MIPGFMILQYLVERFQAEDITVSHYGVREGYIRKKSGLLCPKQFPESRFQIGAGQCYPVTV